MTYHTLHNTRCCGGGEVGVLLSGSQAVKYIAVILAAAASDSLSQRFEAAVLFPLGVRDQHAMTCDTCEVV